jgi:Xaa-Pro aminopeptidase
MDTSVTSASDIQARLARLRARMATLGIDAWLALSSDPHLSEYLPRRWQTRFWLSGFGGSAGSLLVTRDSAALWVDSRYWVEADLALAGTGIETVKVGSASGPVLIDGLAARLSTGTVLATDGWSLGLGLGRALATMLERHGCTLRTDLDPVGDIWEQRPRRPTAPVTSRDAPFESRSRTEKLGLVRAAMAEAGCDWHLVSSLDDVAWLTNLRGADVPYNPVFLAHVLIGPQQVQLFVDAGKVSPQLRTTLSSDGIECCDYDALEQTLSAIPNDASLLIDPRRTTWSMTQAAPASVRRAEQLNPSTLLKSRKTDTELAHVRRTMEHDGAALCEFFSWLEQALDRQETITELTIDAEVTARRARRPGFVSPSFGTIAGFNANGAAPHYSATESSHAIICEPGKPRSGLLLIDSGGQYEGGTTDITRVVQIGTSTAEQRRDFTLVLKGMMALSRVQMPTGTRSPMLDIIARAPLWAAGIDYGHGTGHGVGYFLNVHEGPQSISPHMAPEPSTTMEPGMITSNEPGIYRPGKWGVRLENLLATVPGASTDFGTFLRFETLTLCPIDQRCIDPGLLEPGEIDWLNAYHRQVRDRVSPLVSGDALTWLERATAPLGRAA